VDNFQMKYGKLQEMLFQWIFGCYSIHRYSQIHIGNLWHYCRYVLFI